MLRRLLMALVGAVTLGEAAIAADIPPPPPPPVYAPPVPIFTWTGVYIGGQIGYAWGNQNINLGDNFGDFVTAGFSASGVIGGAHVGYNLQLNQFVLGLEGDVDGSSLSNTASGVIFPLGIPTFATYNSKADIQGSIRGRLGYAWDRVLLYATGGIAFLGVNANLTTGFPFFPITQRRAGASAGPSEGASNMPSPAIGRSAPNIAMPISASRPYSRPISGFRASAFSLTAM